MRVEGLGSAWLWIVVVVMWGTGAMSCQQRRSGHASYEIVRLMDRDHNEREAIEFPDTIDYRPVLESPRGGLVRLCGLWAAAL